MSRKESLGPSTAVFPAVAEVRSLVLPAQDGPKSAAHEAVDHLGWQESLKYLARVEPEINQ